MWYFLLLLFKKMKYDSKDSPIIKTCLNYLLFSSTIEVIKVHKRNVKDKYIVVERNP